MAQNTPILENGPFTLHYSQGGWDIDGADGITVTRLTGRLIDGSGRTEKYPGGVIRSEECRKQEAQFVVDAMNAAYQKHVELSGNMTFERVKK